MAVLLISEEATIHPQEHIPGRLLDQKMESKSTSVEKNAEFTFFKRIPVSNVGKI